ncbi:MAG TPA: polysaccharide biosynthesis tyrosine autokinase [Verrucomicrobiae bacterium]|nr:polysaccharide biosynthesis tyrosine autokinase [Verrucomicrobiae bacterium]
MDEGAFQAFDAEFDGLDESPEAAPVADVIAPERSESNLRSSGDSSIRDSLLAGCRRANWVLDPQMTVFFHGGEHVGGAEEFRSLRSHLYRARKKQSLKSVLVASALSGEGRSFVAVNLAQALALQAGCRVLLIDADLRNPRLHSALGTAAEPGFSDYLLGEADELAVMQRGHADGFFLIPSGRPVGGQTELVANGRLQSLIEQVESLFDWIIVDSPPAISVTDASLLANSCDGVVLIVRSHSTPFDVVRKARERFREESMVGVVLNKIVSKASPRVSF